MTPTLPDLGLAEMFRVKPRRRQCEQCQRWRQAQALVAGDCVSCLMRSPSLLFEEAKASFLQRLVPFPLVCDAFSSDYHRFACRLRRECCPDRWSNRPGGGKGTAITNLFENAARGWW